MLWFSSRKSESARSSNAQKKLDILADSIDDLVIFLDGKSLVLEVNKNLYNILGLKREGVVGKKIDELPIFDKKSKNTQEFLKAVIAKRPLDPTELDLTDRFSNPIKTVAKNSLPKSGSKDIQLLAFREIAKLDGGSQKSTFSLDFLSQVSLKLSEYLTEQEIYQYIADQLAFLVPQSYIMVTRQDTPNHIEVVAAGNSSKLLRLGIEKVKNPVGMSFDLSEEAKIILPRGKLVEIKGGFYTITFGKMPKAVCYAAEKAMRIKKFYAIGFFWRGKLFGNAAIVTRADGDVANQRIIETFIHQASVALHRRKTEEEWERLVKELDEEKKSLSEERDKINTILLSIGDGVFVVDRDLKVMVCNGAAEKISGVKSNEAIGKKFSEIFKFVDEKEKKPSEKFIYECMRDGEIKRIAKGTVLERQDGSSVPVDDSAAPLKDEEGKVVGCVIVFRDVTGERQVDQVKSEFVSLASHQLKSPLSAINWYTEMLLAGDAGAVNEKQKDFLEEVYHSSQHMVDLVNALLNVSRLELGTFIIEPEMVHLKDISKSVFEEMKPKILGKKLKIEGKYEFTDKISADPKLTRIIFQNLISNSVKYTPDGGKIVLSIKKEMANEGISKQFSKGSILITIEDTGYGIPKSQQSQIFSKLFRADNIKPKVVEGTGLGLYIVKSIVDHSGGQIWFDSKENRGTSFYVRFPLIGMPKKEGTKKIS